MKIRELEELRKRSDALTEEIDRRVNTINELSKELSLEIDKNKANEIMENIDSESVSLRKAKSIKNGLHFPFPHSLIVHFNREMLGNEIAKLITEITDKEFVYQENYLYKQEDLSQYGITSGINTVRYKVFTIVNKETINNREYIEYYDVESMLGKPITDNNLVSYQFDYYDKEKNGDLYSLPFLTVNSLYDTVSENDVLEYQKGNTVMEFITSSEDNDYDAVIKHYTNYRNSLEKAISDFIAVVIIKGLYLERKLTEEEIAKIREKFIELYKNDYFFKNFENYLYDIDDVKVIQKNIEK